MWLLYLGLGALALDLFLTSFYLFGVGVALMLTGALCTWVFETDSLLTMAWVMVVAIPVSLGIMHRLKLWSKRNARADERVSSLSPVGAVCHIVMKTGSEVKLGYSGSQWPVVLEYGDVSELNLGDKVEVLRQDGVVLVCKRLEK